PALEVLDGPLVSQRLSARRKGSEVPAPAGARVLLDRVQAVPAVLELADHVAPRERERAFREKRAPVARAACRSARCVPQDPSAPRRSCTTPPRCPTRAVTR